MLIRADLHIHSCLSPCGSLEMSPSAIVERAVQQKLDLIAITDHNSGLNCTALKRICEARGDIKCFYGMEVTSTEEVHLLTLFDELDSLLDFSSFIYDHLPPIKNNPDAFGDQVYVDEDENILGEVDKYLGSGVDLSIDELEEETHSRGAVFIPSHIDRDLYSMISQLGFLPPGNYDAVEFYRHSLRRGIDTGEILKKHSYPVITNSDSHFLDGIGTAGFNIEIDNCSVEDLRIALRQGKATPFF